MSTPTAAKLREILEPSATFDLSMADIASHMDAMGWMHCLLQKDDDGQLVAQGETDQDGAPRPRFFSDFESLHEFAKSSSDVRSSRSYDSRSEPWLVGLLRMWKEEATGLVLDAGDGIALELDRDDIRALIMAFAMEWFVSPSDLCVVMRQGRVYYHASETEQKQAFAFTTREFAYKNLARMRSAIPSLVVAPVDPSLLLDGTLGAGVDRVFVDPGLPGERSFSADDLEALREIRQSCEPDDRMAATAASFGDSDDKDAQSEESESISLADVDLTGEPVSDGAEAEVDSATSDFLDALVPTNEEIAASATPSEREVVQVETPFEPRRSDSASHQRVLEIKALSEAEPKQTWRVSEYLAKDLDLWVPVSEKSTSGKLWPHVDQVQASDGTESGRSSVYSSEAEAKKSFARADQSLELIPMTGFDAFRWIWSAPSGAVEIAIDPEGESGGLLLHRNALPAILFPAIQGIDDLSLVPDENFYDLGGLTWRHGLKPEVIRAFALKWSELLGPPLTGGQTTVEFGGKDYLPLFSSNKHYQDYVRQSGAKIKRPIKAKNGAPFSNWLRLSARCEGLILNPPADGVDAGETLTLDPVELFHLHLWSQDMAQPEGVQLANSLAELQQGDYSLDQTICGQIAADWPLYLAAMGKTNGRSHLVKVPLTDDLALFTGERELAEFKRTHRGDNTALDDVEPHQMLPRWRSSFFTLANSDFSGICINPGASGTPKGVRLDGKGLDGALQRLEERLCPQVPGFTPK